MVNGLLIRKKINITALSVLVCVVLSACSSNKIYAPVYSDKTRVKVSTATTRIVRAGDTLYSIAWQSGKNYKELAKWNGISWPYTIYKGQRLRLVPNTTFVKTPPITTKINKKTYKKQKITKKTSKVSQKGVQLVWRWPVNVKKKEKGFVPTGLLLIGSAGELVRSSEAGKVVYAGNGLKGYGNLLIIKHNDDFLTAYGYSKRLLVKDGTMVKRGQAIAEIGMDNKNRPVLFFEIRRQGKAVMASKYMP
jgi:lipoprotein NlpD